MLDIYREYVFAIQCYHGEYIVNITKWIDKLVYEVKLFGLKGKTKVPTDLRYSKYYVKAGQISFQQHSDKLTIQILYQTRILYLTRHASVILIVILKAWLY